MRPRTSHPSPIWVAVLLAALGFLVWINGPRRERVERVTAIAQAPSPTATDSPTGYATGTRELIVPERLSATQECLALTQQMIACGEWRVRHFDRENAPFGREVHATSPYRWWLGFVAWIHHVLQARPVGLSVERAALYADPLLHALWLAGATALAARSLGALAATVVAVGGVAVFPFAAGFLPGVPEDHALALVLGTLSVLLLLGNAREPDGREVAIAPGRRSGRRKSAAATQPAEARREDWRLVLAGIVGGLGIWNNVQAQVPLLLGIAGGAITAAWITRRTARHDPTLARAADPWRAWSRAGAATILGAWLIEFSPAHLASWEMRVVHPLYALAWLGGGELLARISQALARGGWPRTPRDVAVSTLALLAFLSMPVAGLVAGNAGPLAVEPLSFRLTKQIDAAIVPNLTSWIAADGLTVKATTVLLPLAALAVTVGLLARRSTPLPLRRTLALAVGPTLVAAGLGYLHLRWWQMAGGCSIIALAAGGAAVVSGTESSRVWRVAWIGVTSLMLVLGAYHLMPGTFLPGPKSLSVAEAEAVVGRHLAQWLARRSGTPDGAIVLAPPTVSSTLSHHANLRGIASLSWENRDGIGAAIRVAISTSRDETHALLERREVNYIVLPSWDAFFEPFVQSASVQVGSLFLPNLQRWIVPPWLRPIPYEMPKIPGFEKHSVVIFERVEEQDEPVALSRLTEYFIEMSQPQNAQAIGQSLRRFPADFSALVARAQLEAALGQGESFAESIDTLLKRLASGGDRSLPLDRRVSLASVLARAQRYEQARDQVKRCLAALDEPAIRSLTPYGLYHFLGLCKGFGLRIADARLEELAREVLPVDLRARL